MPKYYCDYCDTYLTHDSPSVRKTHCTGRKHKDNVKFYYQKWMEQQAQHLIDATTAAFKAGKIQQNPFTAGPPKPNVTIPPPGMGMAARPGMMPGMQQPPLMMGANPGPPIMGMRPPMMMPLGMPPGLQMHAMRPPMMNGPPPQMK
ncbi:U1 small nuclear ribonucleoprotein C [Culex quinquefasciatus]|uniref:U1 small nuclear ribonucleoprotein C n=2 Tax=Culex pipiens complex TaxID=518105 RepID=B0XIH6_CULQU|nr:U1 small nuclear ribonucleoprotein C [Culex quinquefasciatus]XP_038121963.1 U1 small nuclear ribonucleoprotein C [Culex quinquefasciatus]XP_039447906.1 U1 small nuclear ribonucleoprotein C-like [Culex pipiens pallens]EDS29280.1 U1 small nuclear ribonucleoprotein C [Culex quinquefasciatus]|eukprot:XP_001869448.1 U1 small nuclear ribonucleoprotein C [Culex quinquefasciatus]